MVTAVNAVANSASSAVVSQEAIQQPALSDAAQATLDRLGQMHTDYNSSMDSMKTQESAKVRPSDSGDSLERAVTIYSQSVQDSLAVQRQLVNFSMATAISQSLGNNLNSFLKGT